MKGQILFIFCCCALLSCFVPLASPQNPEDSVTLKAELDNATITIGDRVHYKITVTHPVGISILDIDTSAALKDFEIKDEKPFSSQEKGTVTEGKLVTITSFDIGNYVLEPAKISYQISSGSEPKQILSNKLYVVVETVDKSGKPAEDIRGAKNVVGFRGKLARLFLLLASLFSFGAIAFEIWRRFFRKKLHTFNSQEAMLSPEEEAYRALDQLFDSDLLRRAQYKLYCSNLTEILKRYLERRYHFLALESTTYELMQTLKNLQLKKEPFEIIDRVMNFCDLVKFAKYVPQPSEFIELNKSSRKIVELTREITAAQAAVSESNTP